MKNFRMKKLMIFVLSAGPLIQSQYLLADEFDVVTAFAYPISMMQSVRQNLNQALYFLGKQDHTSVIPNLEDALSKLGTRMAIEQDDRDYIQAMIDQINALIASLESEQERSEIAQLCQEISDYLV